MYGELKHFMKLFTRFEIFLNIQNSYQKFNFHESQSIERNWASIEVSFQSIRRESNTDWIKSRLQDIIHHHFDRLSKSFDQSNILNFEFHLENSRFWIFILWNNILQTQISLLQHFHVYTYIYNNLPRGCNNICLTWLIFYNA